MADILTLSLGAAGPWQSFSNSSSWSCEMGWLSPLLARVYPLGDTRPALAKAEPEAAGALAAAAPLSLAAVLLADPPELAAAGHMAGLAAIVRREGPPLGPLASDHDSTPGPPAPGCAEEGMPGSAPLLAMAHCHDMPAAPVEADEGDASDGDVEAGCFPSASRARFARGSATSLRTSHEPSALSLTYDICAV